MEEVGSKQHQGTTTSHLALRNKSLLYKPLHLCRYPDNYDMDKLGIRDNVIRLLDRLG